MSAKIIEQTENSTVNQYPASLENNQTIKKHPKQCDLELVPQMPAINQQQSAASLRTNSYKSRSMLAFLAMKL